MSLLMDALKKAEKSKQGASDTASPLESAPSTDWPTLNLDVRPAPAELATELGLAPARGATTATAPAAPPRQASPASAIDLSLEPLPAAAPAPVSAPTEAAPRAPVRPGPAPGIAPVIAESATAARAADRLAAKGVFNAKRGAVAPSRTPFYAVLGVLAAVGAGGTYYVWDEIHPAAPAPVPIPGVPGAAGGVIGKANPSGTPVSPLPAAPSASAEVAKPALDAGTPQIAASGAVATTAEGTAQDARTAGSASAAAMVAAKPAAGGHTSSSASKSTPAPAPGIGTLPASSTEPQGRRERRPTGGNAAIASGGTPVTSPSGLRVTLDRAVPAIDPAVSAGYTALAEGNVEAAREHYARALANDGNNRDALLGMATVALRSGRAEAAEGLFQKLLELHPRDAYANAQLAALRGGDASTSESHVKSLLAGEKDAVSAAPLNFNLGNQFAAQGRWSEAQQAYFNAFTGEPDNPDYCYNLAVSLDQLHQPKLAHEHYVRALGLAQKRRAGFDQARAKARIEQLAASAK